MLFRIVNDFRFYGPNLNFFYSGYFGVVAMLFIAHSFLVCFTQPRTSVEEESTVVMKSSL